VTDPRDLQYARLLVEDCLDVQPGWQVILLSSTLGRPLVEEIAGCIARRGAYVLPRISFDGTGLSPFSWLREASDELISRLPPIEEHAILNCDAVLQVQAPENARDFSEVPPERLALLQQATRPAMERLVGGGLPWVGCQYPTPALAQEAGLSTREFADFLYGACLLDWAAERERMQRYADRFDAASEVRIVGEGTDLRLSIAGRQMKVDAAGANIPGGEFFCSPVEDSAEGEIAFTEFPAVYGGRELRGIRLRFEGGTVVDASAETNEDLLLAQLDSDEGSRRLGELGIGCNPGITRYMRNTLFDEKIDGTAHLALGQGFPDMGGTNVSTIHWDIVKDLRSGGALYLDGELVQENGAWLI